MELAILIYAATFFTLCVIYGWNFAERDDDSIDVKQVLGISLWPLVILFVIFGTIGVVLNVIIDSFQKKK